MPKIASAEDVAKNGDSVFFAKHGASQFNNIVRCAHSGRRISELYLLNSIQINSLIQPFSRLAPNATHHNARAQFTKKQATV